MNKIAIIEDDIDICNMIAKFLENNKYIVHYALNGAEGIELCKSLVPDLIILDIMLPKLNGNDVLQRLRKFTNAPVIVVSAKTMVQTKIDLLKLGADDYMTKPFDLHELLARIEANLKRTSNTSCQNDTLTYRDIEINSLEVDYISAILLPCEDIGQGGFVPLAAVILVERLIFTGSPPPVFHVESGGWDLLLCHIYGDLIAVLPTDKQTENQTDNLGGFFVDYPKILVVRVFDIAVRGFGDNRLSTHAFGLNARFHFLADVLCIPLRHDIDKGRKLQCVGFLAVNAVVDRDKAHIVPSEYLHRVADLEIVAPPAGKVFHNADTDFSVFHIVHHAGVGGTVKKPAAFVVVNVVPDIG